MLRAGLCHAEGPARIVAYAERAVRRVGRLHESTVGQKALMAASGVVLVVFVAGHMLGNLKAYQGPAKFDAYAEFLRTMGAPLFGHGQLLWLVRLGLLAAVSLHVVLAWRLYRRSRLARPISYLRFDDLSLAYASRTMRWGGLIVLAFVVYHLLHLTTGTVHPEFHPGSPYRNLITGFRSWPASLAYVVAMVPLGLHVYHGLWSSTQSLAVRNPNVLRVRRVVAACVATAIVVGNVSIPIAVLAGILD